MVKQRQGYMFVILEPAKTWELQGGCMGCGKLKSEWSRNTKYKCCSTACTSKMRSDYRYFGWPDLRKKVLKRDNYKCVACNGTPTYEKYHNHTWEDIVLSNSRSY